MKCGVLAAVVATLVGGHIAEACTGPGQTEVAEIYPSGGALPENILRLYLYFSAPMAEADILPNIKLRDDTGREIAGVFLSNRFDLWSPDRTRLTLLFDPGRVKTGLEAHDALGRAMVPGTRYRLSVDQSAKDASGCALARPFAHSFTVEPSDVDPPDPGRWQIVLPPAGTRQPLRIALGSAHDHLSMAFLIRILKDGQKLQGRIGLQAAETVWTFTPTAPWAAAPHTITIAEALEDLAGNRPGQLFDQPIGATVAMPPLQLTFAPTTE